MNCVYETYEGKDLSQLKRVTLVIPTYNRNYYLSRCLWYHAHFPFAEIIVADSSDENKREVNRQTILDIQQMFPTKVTYLEYNFPAEKYSGEIYRKWRDAVMHVNTEYSMSCTDKEFLIPTTISKSVGFLDEYTDYSIADGLYYQMVSSKLIVPWQGSSNPNLTSNNIDTRMSVFLDSNHPIGTQFALQRTTYYKSIFENLDRYNLYDLRFGETVIEILPILFGKMRRDSTVPMSIRDVTQNNYRKLMRVEIVKSESSFTRHPSLHTYSSERYNCLLNKLKSCLEENGLCISHGKNIVQKIIMNRYNDDNMRSNILNSNQILKYVWKNILPYRIKVILSKYIGSGLVTPHLKMRERTTEINLISDIINKTTKYHDRDESILAHLGEVS